MSSRLTALAIFVVGFGLIFYMAVGSAGVFGRSVQVDAYGIDGVPIGSVLVSVPYTKDVSDDVRIHVAIDWNENGTIDDEDWSIRNVVPLISKGGRNRFPVTIPGQQIVGEEVHVYMALTRAAVDEWPTTGVDTLNTVVVVDIHDLVSVWDTETPGSTENLKRGLFVDTVHAQGDVDVQRDVDVSDLSGGPMDCFPIAATNNIVSLAEKHGERNKLPSSTKDMIDELKRDMQFKDGVLTQNFVPGKQAFLQRYGLPITTTTIAKPTFADLAKALAEGGAVELSMSHLRSRTGRSNAGHVVTLVGAAAADGQMGAFVHDPATPEGADFMQIMAPPEGNTYWRGHYPLWDGVTVLDYMYVQKWGSVSSQSSSSGIDIRSSSSSSVSSSSASSQSSASSSAEDVAFSIEVLVINGKKYPLSQFRVADPDACDAKHYHGGKVIATDLTSITDPLPGACGFGKVSDVPKETITLTAEEQAKLMGAILEQ